MSVDTSISLISRRESAGLQNAAPAFLSQDKQKRWIRNIIPYPAPTLQKLRPLCLQERTIEGIMNEQSAVYRCDMEPTLRTQGAGCANT